MSFEPIISNYIEVIASIIKRVRITNLKILGVEFRLDEESGSIDERLKKIEIAKENLKEGLLAIEELEVEAEKNKKEVQIALNKINELNEDKNSLEEELNAIKQVISADVSAFKKVAGVPSEKEIKKERMIGFVSGVIASVIASGIVALIVLSYKKFPKIIELFVSP